MILLYTVIVIDLHRQRQCKDDKCRQVPWRQLGVVLPLLLPQGQHLQFHHGWDLVQLQWETFHSIFLHLWFHRESGRRFCCVSYSHTSINNIELNLDIVFDSLWSQMALWIVYLFSACPTFSIGRMLCSVIQNRQNSKEVLFVTALIIYKHIDLPVFIDHILNKISLNF